MMGILQQTTFSVTQYKQNVNVQLSYWYIQRLEICVYWNRTFHEEDWEVHWTAFKKDPGFTNDWSTRVRSSWDTFINWYFQYEWLINHFTISQHSQSLTSSSRAKPRGSGRRLMFYCLKVALIRFSLRSIPFNIYPSFLILLPHRRSIMV